MRELRDTSGIRTPTPCRYEGHEGDDDDDDDDVDDENDGNDNGQREEKVHGQTKKQISKEDASSRGCWFVASDANVVRARLRLTMVGGRACGTTERGAGATERKRERERETPAERKKKKVTKGVHVSRI